MIEIELTQGKVALIDDCDWDLVGGYKWCTRKHRNTFYAVTNIKRADGTWTMIQIHRLILGLSDPKVHVDHRDGNCLNNRRSNLRACTHAENQRNKGAYATNKSGFKGVYRHKRSGKWTAQIKVDGKSKWLGYHATPEAAYAAYCRAAAELHGEFANLGWKQDNSSHSNQPMLTHSPSKI